MGLPTLLRHSRYAAEVYVMAVLPELHRQGIGLGVAWACRRTDGRGRGAGEFLQCEDACSSSMLDDGYGKTLACSRLGRLPTTRGVPELVGPYSLVLRRRNATGVPKASHSPGFPFCGRFTLLHRQVGKNARNGIWSAVRSTGFGKARDQSSLTGPKGAGHLRFSRAWTHCPNGFYPASGRRKVLTRKRSGGVHLPATGRRV